MSLDFEAVNAVNEEKQAENMISELPVEEESKLQFDFSFLLAKTGEGSVDSYIDHPLNFSRSKGIAQILRGATGLVGELDLAVVDIGVGAFNVFREGRKNVAHNAGE